MRSDQLRRYLLCVGVGLLIVRLLGPAWRSGFAPAFPDSASYIAVAQRSPFSLTFWFDERPPTYPLLIWLFGHSPHQVVVAQTCLAVLAWAWLCSTVWHSMRNRAVAVVTIVVLVLLGLQTRWLFWNTAVLTESMSNALAVAGCAAWWRWFDTASRARIVVATAITVSWMLLRDSNAVTLLVVVIPAAIVAVTIERRSTSPWRRGMVTALAVLILTGAYSVSAQIATDRGETNFHNNVGLRWLPDPDMTAWMTERGMPISDALRERSGADAWADGEAFLRSPLLTEYRSWAEGRGRLAAAESFVVRSDWYLAKFFDEMDANASTDHLAYDTHRVAQNFPERTLGSFDPMRSTFSIAVWTATAAAAIAVTFILRRRRGWMLLFFAVPIVADLYLSFAADAVEVGRHLVGPMFRFSVAVVLCVAVGLDTLLTTRGRSNDALSAGVANWHEPTAQRSDVDAMPGSSGANRD